MKCRHDSSEKTGESRPLDDQGVQEPVHRDPQVGSQGVPKRQRPMEGMISMDEQVDIPKTPAFSP